MDHCRCGSSVRWCARADALFDVTGMHVLAAVHENDQLVFDGGVRPRRRRLPDVWGGRGRSWSAGAPGA